MILATASDDELVV